MPPAPLDPRRHGVIMLLQLGERRRPPRQQITGRPGRDSGRQPEQRPRIRRQRQPPRRVLRPHQPRHLRPPGHPHAHVHRRPGRQHRPLARPRLPARHHPPARHRELETITRRTQRIQRGRPRQPQVQPGRHGRGRVLGQHPGRVQPRLPVPRHHRVRPVIEQRQRQPPRQFRREPRSLVHRVRGHRKVQHRDPPQVRDRRLRRNPRQRPGEAELVPYHGGHDLDRDGYRLLEAGPFVFEGAVHVLVAAVQHRLLLTAYHQHRGPQHHQRPQHRRLRGRQRPHRTERAHRGQHRARLGPGVPQHGRDRDRELPDRPRAGQVAEVDHPVRRPPPVHARADDRADDVVIGHVAVHRLPRQVPGQRLDPPPGIRRRRGHPVPQPRIPHVPRQHRDHPEAVPQIPLQHPLEPRMSEGTQRPAHPPRHRPELRHHPRRQVPRPREGAAIQVPQHPPQRGPGTNRHLHRPVRRNPGPQPVHGVNELRRRVLRLDLGPAERRIRDLQHARRPAVPLQEEIAVLLAAQRKSPDHQAERGSCYQLGRVDRHQRDGEPALREEVDPGRLRA